MVRKFDKNDLNNVLEIWLDTNTKTHDFISENYWKRQLESVKNLLPKS
jgi:hypothetical protein